MNVILLTALIGLLLVAFFIAFFLHQNAGQSGGERDALLPLDEETARRPTGKPAARKRPVSDTTHS